MKKVYFPFIGTSLGGSHISALNLVRRMPNGYGAVVSVIQAGPLTEYLSRVGIPYRMLNGVAVRPAQATSLAASVAINGALMVRDLRASQAAIVHVNDPTTLFHVGAWSKAVRCPVVWHCRGAVLPRRPPWRHWRADYVIAISQFVADSLPERYAEKSSVVFNPIESVEGVDRNLARRRLLLQTPLASASQILCGFLGNLHTQKRPELFLQAAAVLPRDVDAHFVIAGEERSICWSELNRLAKQLGLEGRITYVGPTSDPYEFLAALDLFVACGAREGFGRTVVEAMRVGTPVVAVREGAYPELLVDGHTGALADDVSPMSLAAAMEPLARSESLRKELSAAARISVPIQCSPGRHAHAVRGIYDDVLAAHWNSGGSRFGFGRS